MVDQGTKMLFVLNYKTIFGIYSNPTITQNSKLKIEPCLDNRIIQYIAKLSPSFSVNWTEMVINLDFPHPPPPT